MRFILLIIIIAPLIVPPRARAADPDPLAPLVEQEGKEGTRPAYLTFFYQKTVDHQSETEGGPGGVGADKLRDRMTVQTRGQVLLAIQDRDYLNLRILKIEGAGGKIQEIPVPELLQVSWLSTEPAGKLGVQSCSRQTRITGQRLDDHFAMNAWGKPDPKWHRKLVDIHGSDLLNWSAKKPARKADSLDLIHLSLSSQDPDASFAFTFTSGCEVTKEAWDLPPKWSDPHYAKDRPRRSTSKSHEQVQVTLPSWHHEKLMPGDDKDRWTRVVTRSKTGLLVKATRSKTIAKPPDKRFLGSSTRTDERLDVQFDLEAADYEILITPPDGLKDWVPSGGASLHAPGDKLNFKGRIRRTREAAASDREVAVRIELTSSRVPGRCMNWPRNGDREPDLRILRTGTTAKLKIDPPSLIDDEQATHEARGAFKPDEEFTIAIGCYDYGAYGGISFGGSVPVRIEGHDPKVHLPLPADENDNQIADAWERSEGVFEKNLPADWDDVAVPGQKTNGDGICLYERCRGFRNNAGGHARLACDEKYLFIHDPANLLRSHGASMDFMEASQLIPLFIDADQWTGRGSHSQGKRIVNFNHEGPEGPGPRHRVDQHALHLVRDAQRQAPGRDVAPPPGWQRAYATAGVKPPAPEEGATLGYAWPDGLPDGRLGRSPLDKYQISYYTDTIENYVWSFGVDAMPGADDNEKIKAIEAYQRAHPGEFEAQVERILRWTLSHELGHGVGAQHHIPIHGGDLTCYMRYPTRDSYPPVPDDPFWTRYTRWPSAFCRGGGGSVRPTNSCFQHIQVTDHRERR